MSVYDIDEFYVHTALVEMFLGTSGYGVDQFAAPVSIIGFSEGGNRLVRNTLGEQVVSTGQFFTYPVNASLFTPNSRVTISGVAARVITANLNTSGALDLPDHIAISLT